MFKMNCVLPRLPLGIQKIKYGKKLRLIGNPFIFRFKEAEISLGDNVTINSNFWSNLLGVYQRTIIVAKGKGKIRIGARVGISGATIYAWDSIEIGDDTIVGVNAKIVDTDFHPINSEERLAGRNNLAGHAPVKIGKNVFVGMNTLILKGTEIGDNCVIGAGSVLTGKYPADSVIAGNPARVIRGI